MWRTDRAIHGPERATERDIAALNRLFADAFTDRYRRDGMQAVRVPFLNPAVWQYAIANAGEGARLWRDGRGEIAAFNLAHRSGSEGWMGPLAVRVDRQGEGMGRRVVLDAVQWLEAGGATTIGLETMPRTIENIGFYSRLGFLPGPLTITMQGDATGTSAAARSLARDVDARPALLDACRDLTQQVAPGVDFTREAELTLQMVLGDVTIVEHDGTAVGFAVWHAVALAHGRPRDEVRILKLVARDADAAMRVIDAVAGEASRRRVPHVTLRCQGREAGLYGRLVVAGWRVQWTDLRMVLAGRPEPTVLGVMLSNWEI